MHIEPGIVDGAKIALSFATAAGAAVFAARACWDTIRESGAAVFVGRSTIATALVFTFFQVMPHYSAGVSEVHFILGSTLFLLLGAGPTAVGLALGLLVQGALFEPTDLPQYFMNMTTLLVPVFAIAEVAKRIIAPNTPYVDLTYGQALALSTTYQAGIVAWVSFWAFYGQGMGSENVSSVLMFGGAYILVVIVEPMVDLAVLAAAKSARDVSRSALFNRRLHSAA